MVKELSDLKLNLIPFHIQLRDVVFKITLSISLLLCFASMQGQSALSEIVNETFEQDKLSYILKSLDRKYKISIRYNESNLPLTNNSFDFNNIEMRNVLSVVLKEYELDYLEYAPDRIIIVPKQVINEETIKNEQDLIQNSSPVDSKIKEIVVDTIIGNSSEMNGPFTISGGLFHQEEGIALDGALILDKTSGEFTYSDNNGYYELTLDKGIHEIDISSITTENYNITIDLQGDNNWNINIPYKSYYIDEVTISTATDQYKIKETITGLEQISSTEIKQLSTFMGENDVIKSITTVAGVSNIGDGASGFNVRGGNIDQNLILQDGAIILNPSHILGFFSIFNADIVSTTSLFKGHMPANYGGRSSSVLDITLREADTEKFKMNGSIGLVSSKVSADIPVINGKSSLLVSGRTSYINWWLRGLNDLDLRQSNAQFYDGNIKYTHKLSDKTKLIGSYFRSFDQLQFSNVFGYSWQNEVGNLQLKHIVNDQFSINGKLILGSLYNNQFTPSGPLAFNLSSGMKYNELALSAIKVIGNHSIKTGLSYLSHKTLPETLSPYNDSQTKDVQLRKEQGVEISAFINDQVFLSDALSVNIGLRASLFDHIGPAVVNTYENDNFFSTETITGTNVIEENTSIKKYFNIEPRASLRYSLNSSTSIKLSYNRTAQYIHLLSNTTTPTPIDIWQVSNTHIRPLIADNYSLGLYSNYNDELNFSIEGFYKNLDNTIDYKDFADLTLNPHLETAVLIGSGQAYGGELSFSKSGEILSGKVNYSYSRSLRRTDRTTIETINNGQWFSSNFDTPHEIKMFLNWKISQRDRLSINFIYKSGRPITAPISNFVVQGVVIPEFSDRNVIRLPDYHRLDISYTFRINRRSVTRYKNDITFSFYNVYGRRNPFSVFYKQELGSSINALQLSVIGTMIPSITYNFSF